MGNPIDIVFSQVPMISSWTILSLAVWTFEPAAKFAQVACLHLMEDGNVSSDDLSSEDFGDPESRVFDMKVPVSAFREESGGHRRCRKTWGELVMNATGTYGYVWNRLSWDICCGEAWRGYPQNPPRNGDRWISLGETLFSDRPGNWINQS